MKKILIIGVLTMSALSFAATNNSTTTVDATKMPMNQMQHGQHMQNMPMNQAQHAQHMQNMGNNGMMKDGKCTMMGNMTNNTNATPAKN